MLKGKYIGAGQVLIYTAPGMGERIVNVSKTPLRFKLNQELELEHIQVNPFVKIITSEPTEGEAI